VARRPISPHSIPIAPSVLSNDPNIVSQPRWSTRLLCALAFVAVMALTASRLTDRVLTASEHPDERGWILSSLYFTDLLLSGDLTSPNWEPSDLTSFGSLCPHLGRFWLAAGLRLAPQTRALHVTLEDVTKYPLREGRQLYPVPPEARHVARLTHAASGLVCVALVFLIAQMVSGTGAALLATTSIAFQFTFINTMSWALIDGPFNALVLCETLCLIGFVRSKSERASWLWILAAGISIGLAFNIKMTALVLGAAVLIGGIAVRLMIGRDSPRTGACKAACALWAAIVFCYFPNPYLWPTASPPASGTSLHVLVPERFGGKQEALSFLEGRAPVLLRLPEMHLRWNRAILHMKAAFPAANISRTKIVRHLVSAYNHGRVGAAIIGLTALVGIFRLRQFKRTSPDERSFVSRDKDVEWNTLLVIVIIHVVWLVALLPLDWDRYFLPAILHLHILQAAAVVWGIGWLRARYLSACTPLPP
jgi:hypothetical protein